jgi:g-D-glutamyl-meso-diaminopimelate peptidase
VGPIIVDITAPFDSSRNLHFLKLLAEKYPFLQLFPIGKTRYQTDILCAKLGRGDSPSLIVGAHHALEWITSLILLSFIEEVCDWTSRKQTLLDYDLCCLFETRSTYIVPLLNCDGVDLVQYGLSPFCPNYEELLRYNNDSCDFSQKWQANSAGVDLNHNYDALWECAKRLEPSYGIYGPGPTRFGGPCPESEPEVQALCRLIRSVPFRHVTSYHTQGEVIYWDFGGKATRNAFHMAQLLSNASGYVLDTTSGIASYGGLKDWVIDKFSIPAFTVEAGHGTNPLPLCQFNEIYEKNRELLLLLLVL